MPGASRQFARQIVALPYWVKALLGTILGGVLIVQGVRSHPDNWGEIVLGGFLVVGFHLVELRRRIRKRRASDG